MPFDDGIFENVPEGSPSSSPFARMGLFDDFEDGIPDPWPPVADDDWHTRLIPSIPLATEVMKERKGSGKFSISGAGVHANREWVVPWFDPATGKWWKDYVGELLGTPVTVNAAGQATVVTYPAIFHDSLPFLICKEVDVEGEDPWKVDYDGKQMYRRAILKAKYQPLDHMEKIDIATQFQSVPGYQFLWVGQDARRAGLSARWLVRPTGLNVSPSAIFMGQIAFSIVKLAPPPAPNQNFLLIVGKLSQHVQALSEPAGVLDRTASVLNMLSSHDGTLDIKPQFQEDHNRLQNLVANANPNTPLQPSGLLVDDAQRMQIMIAVMGDMNASLNAIFGHCQGVLTILQSEAAPVANDIGMVNALMAKIQAEIAPLGADITNSMDLAQVVVTPQVTEEHSVDITVDFVNKMAEGNAWDPPAVQALMEIVLGSGNVQVTAIDNVPLSYDVQFLVPGWDLRIDVENTNVYFLTDTTLLAISSADEELLLDTFTINDLLFGRHLDILNFRLALFHVNSGRTFMTPYMTFTARNPQLTAENIRRGIQSTLSTALGHALQSVRVTAYEAAASPSGSPPDQRRFKFGVSIRDITDIVRITRSEVDFDPNVTMTIEPGDTKTAELLQGNAIAGRFVPLGHYSLEKRAILEYWKMLLMGLKGCVNKETFQGFPPWTLLVMGIEAKITHVITGERVWTMTFKFGYNPNTWNAIFRGDRARYEFVRSIATLPPTNGQPTLAFPRSNVLTLPDGSPLEIPSQGTGLTAQIPPRPGQGNVPATVRQTVTDLGFLYPETSVKILDTFY